MVGDVTDICPYTNKPANECKIDDVRSKEHDRWHMNQLVELGFMEISGMDSDGNPIITTATVKVSKLALYDLASKIAHEQIGPMETIDKLDEWRNSD